MNALLIGINYTGTGQQLQGCIFDIIEMKSLIVDAYRFDPNRIVVLRDDDPANRPTKARILQELTKLVANSDTSSNTFLHYSGHGTQITDTVDESDKLDECIVPCDYATAGYITDDEINAIFKPLKGSGLALFDCCRSGTIMDLPFSGTTATTAETQSQGFYCFSGCTDAQDVQEGTQGSATGLPQGAMTLAFISTIRSLQYYPPVATLLTALRAQLLAGGYSQTPQLTSSVPLAATTPFPFQAQASAQLQTQIQLVNTLQQQIPILEAQIVVLQQQVTLLPVLEASAQLLSVVQKENQAQNEVLEAQRHTLSFLQQQAALVPKLQAQVQLIPGLQNQIAALMYQQMLVQQLQKELAAARR